MTDFQIDPRWVEAQRRAAEFADSEEYERLTKKRIEERELADA